MKIRRILAIIVSVLLLPALCSCGERGARVEYSAGEIPGGYREKCPEGGEVARFTYETENYAGDGAKTEKAVMIYTPFGYDGEKQYNILYLQHGAGGSEATYMGDPDEPRDFRYIVDNLIMNGDIEPLIVVMTTVGESESGEYFSGMQSFSTELREDIIPAVEGKYSTYARGTDEASLAESRSHRAFAGFSMGGYIAWDTFRQSLDYFAFFAPMSCYYYDMGVSDRTSDAAAGAALLAGAVRENGFTGDDFRIFSASGSEDFLHEETRELVDSLCAESSDFVYTDTPFEGGNITFYLGYGGEHGFRYSLEYLYNALPLFFK